MTLIHIIYFICITLFWSGSFLAIRYAIADISPIFAAFLRVFTAFLFFIPYLYYLKQNPKKKKKPFSDLPQKKYILASMASGMFAFGLSWVFLFWAEKYIPPALAAVLNSTCPIMVVMLSYVITPNDKMTFYKWLGVTLGLIGVVIIFWPELASSDLSLYTKGMIAVLITALCYSIGILWTRRLMIHLQHTEHVFFQVSGGSLLLFLAALTLKTQWIETISIKALLSIFYLGLGSTAIASLMFNRIIREVGSVQASVITLFLPVVAIILDMLFLNTWLTLYQGIGTLFILVAVVIINRKKKTQIS